MPLMNISGTNTDKIEEEPQEYLQHLIEFLLSWLINHILYTDKKIPLVENSMTID